MRYLVILLLVVEAAWAWRCGRPTLIWDHYHELGHAQLRQKQLVDSRQSFTKAWEAGSVLGDARLGQSELDLAYVSEAESKFDEALQHAKRAVAVLETHEGSAGPLTGVAWANLGRLHLLANRPEEALPHLQRGLAVLDREKGLEDELTLKTAVWTMGACRRVGSLPEAWRLAARIWPHLDTRSPEIWQLVARNEVQLARETLRSLR